MKNVLWTILQFLLFLLLFAAGSFVPVMHLQQVLSTTAEGTRIFYWDGIVLMTLLFLVILGIEAARKRLRTAAPWTALALALAAIAGLAMKFGFLTRTP